MDLQNGDILVISSDEYTIRGSASFPAASSGSSFDVLATVSASTKRYAVDGTTGKRTTSTVLTGISVWALQPVSTETLERFPEIASPQKLLQTFLRDADEVVQLVLEEIVE